jgi:myo-inositol-1(or 4)-monophosphatase
MRHAPVDKSDIDARAELAMRLADAAREAILPWFRAPRLSVENKATGHFDPVTQADRAAETAMRAIIEAEFPGDGILGEEFGTKPSRSGLTWVLDPIDGTRGFMSGTPTWGVLIALSDDEGPILGIIDQPWTGERFIGGTGGAFFQHGGERRPISVAPARSLAEATLFTTFPEVGTPEEGRAFRAVAERVRLVRYGMDCYAYALIAAGQIDLVIEAGLHPYDVHAPIAVITAAGGVVTDWRGGPAHRGGRILAAASAGLHAEALALLAGSIGEA